MAVKKKLRNQGPFTEAWSSNPQGLILRNFLGEPPTHNAHPQTSEHPLHRYERPIPSHGHSCLHALQLQPSPDHSPQNHCEGRELCYPFYCRCQGQQRRAMSAISTCHSPPSLATGHKRQILFYLHQHSP
jgi:hypothetical protein